MLLCWCAGLLLKSIGLSIGPPTGLSIGSCIGILLAIPRSMKPNEETTLLPIPPFVRLMESASAATTGTSTERDLAQSFATFRWWVDERLRRVMDVTIALSVIICGLPIWLVCAVAIWWSDPGPVLFRQTRIGLRGRPFEMFKFRSMYCQAEQCRAAVTNMHGAQAVTFKSKHDPRIFPSAGYYVDSVSMRFLKYGMCCAVIWRLLVRVQPSPKRSRNTRLTTVNGCMCYQV